MTTPFVHSNYPRVQDDHYSTRDPRCVLSFLEHFVVDGKVCDVCSPNGSGIIEELQRLGYDGWCASDAFSSEIAADWIITNPPYTRGLVDKIIHRQIDRFSENGINGLAMLLRANFDMAKSRASMFEECELYYGQIRMRFRPWWSEERKAQPIHNYVWHIWMRNEERYPIVLYSDGIGRNP